MTVTETWTFVFDEAGDMPAPLLDLPALAPVPLLRLDAAPPFAFAPEAGIAPIGVGERVWLEFNLAPGDYLVGCPIPDVAAIFAGKAPLSHIEHGMVKVINVVE